MLALETLAVDRILGVAAHPDDIEIGCGATLLAVRRLNPAVEMRWIVLTGNDVRSVEAAASAAAYGAGGLTQHRFRDGYLPYADPAGVKDAIAAHRDAYVPDVVFAPRQDDAHQDHAFLGRLVGELYRRQTVLHYEIPKYDGDLGQVNLYVSLAMEDVEHKIDLLFDAFPSQKAKPWFDEATFRGLMRLRGVEAASPSGYAEGFVAPKLVVG